MGLPVLLKATRSPVNRLSFASATFAFLGPALAAIRNEDTSIGKARVTFSRLIGSEGLARGNPEYCYSYCNRQLKVVARGSEANGSRFGVIGPDHLVHYRRTLETSGSRCVITSQERPESLESLWALNHAL